MIGIEKVVTLRQAANDLRAGRDFYDEVELGVGQYFRSSLLADIGSLHLFAGIHPIRNGFHCMLAQRFPYAIYYFVDGNVAKVVALLDLRKDPLWIRKQLEERK